ncbi:unnamed protein product [Rotaria sp. Silwood1]|nr:unnamed protein product [Rotaria sp. Silwood1]
MEPFPTKRLDQFLLSYTPDCFFLPITNCSIPSKIDGNQTITIDANVGHWSNPIIPSVFQNRTFNWYRVQMVFYLMRYKPETLAHVQYTISKQFNLSSIDFYHPYIAVYVRRSDKATTKEMSQVYTLKQYFDLFDGNARQANISTIYINSEDEKVLNEFVEINKEKQGYYKLLNLTLQKNIVFGTLTRMTSEQRGKVILDFLTDLFIETNADLHVGTLTSNWCRLVDEMRLALGKLIPFYTPENIYKIDWKRNPSMNENGSSEGVGVVIRHTADLSKMIVAANDTNQKHMEYLPYPDWNFNEESEEFLQKTSSDKNDEQCPLEQIYLRCNKTFLPGQSVQVIKIEAERIHHPVIEFLYPYLYTITIRYGSTFEWTIKKRYKDFYYLHQALRTYVTSELAKSCNNLNSVRPSETIDDHDSSIRRQEKQLPCFPTRNDRIAFINEFSKNERCKILQNYLNKVLKHPKLREHSAMRNFLGVSPLSFVRGLGKSLREAELLKRSNDDYRGRSIFIRLLFSCDIFKFHRNRKWFVIKDSYIVYMKIDSALVGFPMLVDHAFSIDRRFRKTKTTNGIRIKNLQRLMVIKCQSGYERDKWFDTLMEIKNKSLFTQQHLFKSFAPQRQQQYAQWFINGQPYMEALAKAILAAREEIYISDWWLSPEIMLIRPYQDDSMRLDNLLGKRAEEGIRIYILIFKDILSVVGLNSYHTKKQLVSKSPNKKNIKIIRHPNHRVLPGTESSFLYSHHEKTVVIDQRLAFIGGLDLCWGRWDTDDHRLVDLSNENITELKSAEELANQSDQESTKEEAAVDTAKQMAKNNTNQGIVRI